MSDFDEILCTQLSVLMQTQCCYDPSNIDSMLSQSGPVVYRAMFTAQMVMCLSPKPPIMLANMLAGTWSKKT